MKCKKLLIILFIAFAYFMFTTSSYAKVKECVYTYDREKNVSDLYLSISIKFSLEIGNSGRLSPTEAKVSGSDKGWFSDEDVLNWDNPHFSETTFTGYNYYQETGECPTYAILAKWYRFSYWFFGTHDVYDDELYLSDLDNLEKIKWAIKGNSFSMQDGNYPLILKLEEDYVEPVKETPSSCMDFGKTPNGKYDNGYCEKNDYFACIWNETEYGDYCNVDNLRYIRCGDSFDIPVQAPTIVSLIVNLLKIGAPIILVITGMISLIKALAASKDDEITKTKNSLVKKLIVAVILFFVVSIVQFVVSIAADEGEAGNFSTCLSCFLNDNCSGNMYYKTNIAGTYLCTYIKSGRTDLCDGESLGIIQSGSSGVQHGDAGSTFTITGSNGSCVTSSSGVTVCSGGSRGSGGSGGSAHY